MAKTRASGEGNIRKRQDGRWEVRLTVDIDFETGEPKRISRYANTQAEAVQLLHQMKLELDQGAYLLNSVTVAEWLQIWLNTYMKHAIKQSTMAGYETYVRKHFTPAFGHLPLRELTPRLLQEYYNYKFTKEGLSPKTISNMNLCLHKALEQAVREGLIPSNPASALNLPRGYKPEIEILTMDEQARLIHASYQDRYGVFIRLTLFTGLRIGELLGLKWEDIDFRAGVLHVRRTLNRLQKTGLQADTNGTKTEIVIQEPKTPHSIRTIPLLPAVVQDLNQWRAVQQQDQLVAQDAYLASGMIVTNPLGGFIEPRTFKDYYNRILASAGIGHKTFHALRHTFASRALECGMDSKTLSVILGHSSVSFTLDTYAHVLDGHKRESMSLMENLYTPESQTALTYSAVVTLCEDGSYLMEVPDFPGVSCQVATIEPGLESLRDQLHERVLTAPTLPPASKPEYMNVQPGQMVFQIAV